MLSAFLTGLLLGFSLIIAIGAQNTFVLRQGIGNNHIFYIVLFCAISDAILIIIGISGISYFINGLSTQISDWLFGFSAIWLSGYGILRVKALFRNDKAIIIDEKLNKNLSSSLLLASIITFANPHVYIDTMVLIGAVSQQFLGENKFAFGFGAILASFIFFFSLGYGARLLIPIMQSPNSWRVLDAVVAIIMFVIAISLAYSGNWI
tara:strand:+ start:523 stop:1143 length:621 start_codon:yes stop_codon:yes gene_type:complete